MGDLVSSDSATVYNRGITTGTTAGTVRDMDVQKGWTSYVNYSGFGVRSGRDSGTYAGTGDSGGAVYEERWFDGTKYAYLVHLQSEGENDIGLDKSCDPCGYSSLSQDLFRTGVGTAFYHIFNNHDPSLDI